MKRELIVIAKSSAGLRVSPSGVASIHGSDVSGLKRALAGERAVLKPLFGLPEDRLLATAATLKSSGAAVPDLSRYYRAEGDDAVLDRLAAAMRASPLVEAAYIKPMAEPADFLRAHLKVAAASAPALTPDFGARQGYLGPAPEGIDARYAWTRPGGRGAGVAIIDIEWGWRFTHEDLQTNQGGVLSGANDPNEEHGTAVAGIISGDINTLGITGIAPDARISGISLNGHSTSEAIRMAADRLRPGDILLIEAHREGPRSTGQMQFGYIAIEWWPDDFDAIRYAVARGVIVVEAAGNGGQDLDDAAYDVPSGGFPPGWRNPFNDTNPSSGAILVGAGNPPSGTHGRNSHPAFGEPYADRARCYFSNYGRRLDVQGWGWEVTTTGYGDLQGGTDPNQWYTDQFSGTSSASPMVVGAIACLQGSLIAAGKPPLSPSAMQALLRASGSGQGDGLGFTFSNPVAGSGYPQIHPMRPWAERIGSRPDLRQMIDSAVGPPKAVGTAPLHRFWNSAIGDHAYSVDRNEFGAAGDGYVYEGVACQIYTSAGTGTTPLYRYWNAAIGDHFYTTDFNELGNGRWGFQFERVEGHLLTANTPGSLPLYRYWSDAQGDHFYTILWTELGTGRFGYTFESVVGFVLPAP